MSLQVSKFKKEKKNYILLLAFIITAIPGGAINVNIKYFSTISLLLITVLTNKNLNPIKNQNQSFIEFLRNTFDTSIYIYLFGILLSSLISNTSFTASLTYTFLFLFRILVVKSITNKIDIIKIFDSIVIGLTISTLIGVIFYRPALLLIIKLLQFKIGGIAGNRLMMWGLGGNALGVNLGICCCYVISRILIDQYKLCEIEIKERGYFQFNSFKGYLILFFNFTILFLCSTRSAYLSIFLGNLPIVLKIISNRLYISNPYNKYYLLFVGVILFNVKKLLNFVNKFILLQDDRYRGLDTGLTGRLDIWQNKIGMLGPLGYGYLTGEIFDNNFFYTTYLSGFLFSLPLFIYYGYSLINFLTGFYQSKENLLNNFEYFIKAPLNIYCFINFFLTQQTVGMTSIIGYFFILIPLGRILEKEEEK